MASTRRFRSSSAVAPARETSRSASALIPCAPTSRQPLRRTWRAKGKPRAPADRMRSAPEPLPRRRRTCRDALSAVLIEMDEAALKRDGHRMCAVLGVELPEYALEVRLHRF